MLLSLIKRVERLTSLAGIALAALGLFAMALSIVVAVILRYFFNAPIPIIDEVAAYILVGLAFLGLADTFKAGRHIRVTLIYDRIPKRIRGQLELVFLAIFLGYTIFLVWLISKTVQQSYKMGSKSWGVLEAPLFIPELLMPIGLSLLALALFVKLTEEIIFTRMSKGKTAF